MGVSNNVFDRDLDCEDKQQHENVTHGDERFINGPV